MFDLKGAIEFAPIVLMCPQTSSGTKLVAQDPIDVYVYLM